MVHSNTITPETNQRLLHVKSVHKTFGATQALVDATLEIRPGEVHALVGENGAGKSTMIKVLAGAHQADRGEILWQGEPYRVANPSQARRLGIATCYQELAIAPHMTVAENILLGQELSSGGWLNVSAGRQRAGELMESLEQGHIPLNAMCGRLPLAAQQFVEIARAIASNARLIILDEPTSALTQSDTLSLFRIVRRLRGQGISFLYVSHFLEEIMELCDRFTVMRDGRTVAAGVVAETSIDQLVSLMVGRKVEDLYPRVPHEAGEPLLGVSDLSGVKDKPGQVSFEVRRGEILGFAGLLGSGRSELLRTIYGLQHATGGQVTMSLWPQEDLAGARTSQLWQRMLGFCSEDRKSEGLALRQSLGENIALPALGRAAPGGWLRPALLRSLANDAARELSTVYRDIGQPATALSGGNQQKIALARLLFAQSQVMLLDEPTRGIDVAAKGEIFEIMNQLALQGLGVLFVSSELKEVLAMADRVLVMAKGRIVAEFRRPHLTQEAIVAASVMANEYGQEKVLS